MGEKKKKKDKDRQDEKKKNKKKNKAEKKDKKKRDKKARSSSRSSDDSSDSSVERSRRKNNANSTKKDTKDASNDQKGQSSIQLPFELATKTVMIPTVSAPIPTLRPGVIPIPPAPPPTVVATSNKPKTKESHIFKLLPRLPAGCVTLGKTLYSSAFLTPGFEKKLFTSMCEEVERSAKAEGSKKMASAMSKIRNEIGCLDPMDIENKLQPNKFQNQFQVLSQLYTDQRNSLKQKYLQKLHPSS